MRVVLFTALLLLVTPEGAAAQDHMAGHGMRADQLKWGPAPPVFPKGAQMTILSGDPSKPGSYTARMRMPAGYRIPPHTHPTAEALTVISGEFGYGVGETFDEAKGETLGPGGFVLLPPNMVHFVFARTETVVQANSEGPFVIKYVNPADDPSRTQ
jgi:quercetin dioxygenase-like cupin family protein